jgi:hypothetical protein
MISTIICRGATLAGVKVISELAMDALELPPAQWLAPAGMSLDLTDEM